MSVKVQLRIMRAVPSIERLRRALYARRGSTRYCSEWASAQGLGRNRANDSDIAPRKRNVDAVLGECFQYRAIERAFQCKLTNVRVLDPHTKFERDAAIREIDEK